MSARKITIENLSILKSPHIHIKNASAVLDKINGILSQGVDILQIISDFDGTITKQHENRASVETSTGIMCKWEYMPESTLNAIKEAYEKSVLIVLNPTAPKELKIEATNKGFEAFHENLKGLKFDRKELEKLVFDRGFSLRERTYELFSKLQKLHVPVVVVSAGLTDVIEEVLKQKNILYDNVNVLANRLNFNDDTLDGFENYENLIGVFNKHEHLSQLLNTKTLKNRKNIILLGDSTGDATMACGNENDGIVLKMGFYYGQTDDGLEIFKDAFDIVLNDDQTMNVVLDIMKLF